MDHLIDRYLDGDLSEAEASALEDALRRNPELENELRAWEEILATADRAGTSRLAPDFTDRVMERIAEAERLRTAASSRRAQRRLPGRAWAMAAVVILAVGVGWLGATLTGITGDPETWPGPAPAAGPADGSGARASARLASTPADGLRLVRLIHVPDGDVHRVTVAGDFNGWDPTATPMTRQDGRWTANLLLPPGTYEYVFVEDGDTWVADPRALETRDDGFGQRNAVLDLTL